MTSHIKDILLLGGVSTIISSTLAYLPQNIIISTLDFVWFIIFVFCLIKLVWTKNVQSLNKFKELFPRLSTYLTYIGWLPYIVTLFSTILVGVNMLTENDNLRIILFNTRNILEYIYVIGFVISLITATYKTFFKKS